MLTHNGANASRGFTLVELLVSLALFGVVAVLTLGSFTTQHRAYVVIDGLSETQQSLRAIANLLERDIRNAGYMVPEAAASCGVDRSDDSDILFLSDSDAVLPCCSPPAPAGEALARELSAAKLGATTTSSPGLGPASVNVNEIVIDGIASYDTDGDGSLDSDFQIAGGAILVDLANPQRGVACGLVTAVGPGTTLSIDFLAALGTAAGLPTEPDLRVVPAHAYRLVETSGVTRLERDGILLARDVEDLQFAWYYDDDADGQVDDPGETRGVIGTPYDSAAIDGRDLREIRFNIVGRTADRDPSNPTAAGVGQPTENRTVAVPSADGFRRRVHTATVRLRNVSL